MYTCSVDDDIANVVKQVACEQNRSIRRQFIHYIIIGMKSEGHWPPANTRKKKSPDCANSQGFDSSNSHD